MSRYYIDIDDEAVKRQIQDIVTSLLNDELRYRATPTNKEIALAVKDIIYSHKDKIVDRVVDKASKEIVRKGLPKLIERLSDDEKN